MINLKAPVNLFFYRTKKSEQQSIFKAHFQVWDNFWQLKAL